MKTYGVFLAGVYAAAGGLLGKFSGYQFSDNRMISLIGQAILFILMISANSASLTLYVKAIQAGTSFKTTVIISSVNFLLSGLFGVFIFGESTGVLWWIGILSVLVGIFLINSSDSASYVKAE